MQILEDLDSSYVAQLLRGMERSSSYKNPSVAGWRRRRAKLVANNGRKNEEMLLKFDVWIKKIKANESWCCISKEGPKKSFNCLQTIIQKTTKRIIFVLGKCHIYGSWSFKNTINDAKLMIMFKFFELMIEARTIGPLKRLWRRQRNPDFSELMSSSGWGLKTGFYWKWWPK